MVFLSAELTAASVYYAKPNHMAKKGKDELKEVEARFSVEFVEYFNGWDASLLVL